MPAQHACPAAPHGVQLPPLHTLPPFREASRARGETLPETDRLGARGLNLPTYAALTEENHRRVCDVIAAACGKGGAVP